MLHDLNPKFFSQKKFEIDNSLILNFITDVGVERFNKYYNVDNYSIVCRFKKFEKGRSMVKLYRFFNSAKGQFFIMRFQVQFDSKLMTFVLTSADFKKFFGLKIDAIICSNKMEMIVMFQKVFMNIEFIQTTLYKKVVMESSHVGVEKRLLWIQNTVDFYNLSDKIQDEQNPHFLQEKVVHFQIIGKKVIKQNNNFIVLTIAEDLYAKTLFIFLYVPKSRRRFVVKFDKELLINSLSRTAQDLTYQMNSTKKYSMKKKIDNIEKLIINMCRKNNKPKVDDLSNWIELFDEQVLWEKKDKNVWLFKFEGLHGIIREFISIRILDSQQILLETYIDGYLNQSDIFKPYSPIIINDLRYFSFFVHLTKPRHIIRKNDNINIYNFLRITNFCSEDQKNVNGKFFKDLVHLLEEKIFEKLVSSELSFHKVSFTEFKQKQSNDAQAITGKKHVKFEDENNDKKKLSFRHTYIGEENYNCKIIPIFSIVFTIKPRRIFSIYFNQTSFIKR